MQGDFPRYAWGWMSSSTKTRLLFEVRLTNFEQGVYKGYFIDLDRDIIGRKEWAHEKLAENGDWHGIIQ